MSNFFDQIRSDIKEYQERFEHIPNIHKDEWCFNYWILDKLFYEDEELIEDKIVDYNDMGIDSFEVYEDTKEIYLIQNKYYSDSTRLSSDYVKNDFLLRSITALENGTYTRSRELQKAFSRLKEHSDFTVHLQLFVTNDIHNEEADRYIHEFNQNHNNYIAKIYYLSDIMNRYYNETEQIRKNISVKIESINNGTILKLNTQNYKLENIIDARYVLTPVVSVFRMYRDSIEKGYPLFEKNIREYLGNTGINTGIYKTLQDKEDRKNFFYYNNGITMICDSMTSISTQPSQYNMNAYFTVENPQIVNGCQTVNTIFEFLSNIPPEDLEKEFKDSFVMLKVLVINRDDPSQNGLYRNIVKYNNSQNSIDEKTFVGNAAIFQRLQNEFASKGFLLLIKQSDKNKFANEYKTTSKLIKLSKNRLNKFDLTNTKKASDFFIPLDKLLQVITAFVDGGHIAYTKKNQVLRLGSDVYENAVGFIKSINDIDTLLDLFCLYKKAELTKKQSGDLRAPIPYYLIDFFGKYECNNRDPELVTKNLAETDQILNIVEEYKKLTKAYAKKYYNSYDIEYNQMIKRPIEYDIVSELRDLILD